MMIFLRILAMPCNVLVYLISYGGYSGGVDGGGGGDGSGGGNCIDILQNESKFSVDMVLLGGR